MDMLLCMTRTTTSWLSLGAGAADVGTHHTSRSNTAKADSCCTPEAASTLAGRTQNHSMQRTRQSCQLQQAVETEHRVVWMPLQTMHLQPAPEPPMCMNYAGMLTSGGLGMWLSWTWTASPGGGQQSAAQLPVLGRAQQQRTMQDTWCSLVRYNGRRIVGNTGMLGLCDLGLCMGHSQSAAASDLIWPYQQQIAMCRFSKTLCGGAAGGHASGGRTNDMLLLELSDWVWSQPATTGTAPSPRSGAALCIGHGRYLVVHGGRNNFVLDSAHVLDLMTKAWVDVSGQLACVAAA